MQRLFEEATGLQLGDLFDAFVRTARDIDFGASLAHAGLVVERAAKPDSTASFGMRTRGEGGRLYVGSVMRGCAAQRAGLDAGDEIIAIGGRRVDAANLDSVLFNRHQGDKVQVLVGRDGRVVTLEATLDGPRLDKVKIVPKKDATEAQLAFRKAWLGD